jgi:hypothetical protein
MSANTVKAAYASTSGGAIPVTTGTPLPVTPLAPALATATLLTGTEVIVTLASTTQALFGSATRAVSAYIATAAASGGQVKVGYQTTPDDTNGLSLPAVPGAVYDLSQVRLAGTIGWSVKVVYFTAP